ncbi:hypothetical protein RM545_04110 [Zunongwangia sp. F260]|uniref:Uncharacterized protein n=1 Tax=Autumnicola lenta TaxID=3075593 RepID=A0ABU3CHP5_9FLAO|nr:hypothetical protein [Zunongwangia sp. F260]MDT0645862.1 hypothetical protein [Zunongwangia sp. F260]
MKKICFYLLGVFLFYSCAEDQLPTQEEGTIPEENLTEFEQNLRDGKFDNTSFGSYTAIFTTKDASSRGSVAISIPFEGDPTSDVNLSTGNIIRAAAIESSKSQEDEGLTFSSGDLSFDFNVDDDGTNPEVSNVTYNGKAGDMMVVKNTSKAHAVPVTGTYSCVDCDSHPDLGTGGTQTFNFLVLGDTDNSGDANGDEIRTQVTLKNRVFSSEEEGPGGMLANCVDNGDGTFTCDVTSAGEGEDMLVFYGDSGPVFTQNMTYTYATDGSCQSYDGQLRYESSLFDTNVIELNSDDSCNDVNRRAQLFVTNNSNGNITQYNLTAGTSSNFGTASSAAEGIFYDFSDDVVVQASRSNLQLEAYNNFSNATDGETLSPAYTSSDDLNSPRELAVNGSTYVVSDNGTNQFYVYTKNGDNFSLTNTFSIPFPVWGITFKGDDLYAVVDTTNDLAVFYDFDSNTMDGTLMPSKRVGVEGIVRTHGLTYDGTDDVMVMTDIGDAANATDDGAFHVINNFSTVFDALSDGEQIPLEAQTRVAGSNTMLGNPIDVAYDSETDAVYISEVGNGKVLGFTSIGSGGNLTPSFEEDLAAASSLYFSSDETDGNTGMSTTGMMTRLYTTSTANGNVNVYNESGSLLKTVMTSSTSTEGVYYSGSGNLIQASRSDMRIEFYENFAGAADGATISPDAMGPDELPSPREIAVLGDHVVVSDNGSDTFFIYSFDGSSFVLENTVDVDFPVWGITFKGGDLLAVVDTTNDLAIFNDFLSNMGGMQLPDKRISFEGLVRTHGIDYSEADDVLIMTDIGDAASDSDGGFHVIEDFNTKLEATMDGGMISMADQTRIAGASTELGNPIDVAYDNDTQTVFIAEIANGGGKILGFTDVLNTSGDIAPAVSNDVPSAASVYLYNN